MAARKPVSSKVAWTPDRVRERIRVGLILRVLMDHVVNGTEMAQSRITAGLGLLRKVVPDLSATAITGSVEVTRPDEIPDSLLAHIATGSSPGATEQTPRPEELN